LLAVWKPDAGWALSGIETAPIRLSFYPATGIQPSDYGAFPVRPFRNPDFTGNVMEGVPKQYFNRNAFVLPLPGTYGNVGRNVLTGPGLATTDFLIAKIATISESVRAQFRAEFFNIYRANSATPNAVVFSSAGSAPSSTAGVITGTSTTSRQIQFGLKLLVDVTLALHFVQLDRSSGASSARLDKLKHVPRCELSPPDLRLLLLTV